MLTGSGADTCACKSHILLPLRAWLQVEGGVFHGVLAAQLDRQAWEEVGRLLDTMLEHEAEVDAEVSPAAGGVSLAA